MKRILILLAASFSLLVSSSASARASSHRLAPSLGTIGSAILGAHGAGSLTTAPAFRPHVSAACDPDLEDCPVAPRPATLAPMPTYWITQGNWWYDNTTNKPDDGPSGAIRFNFAQQPDYDEFDLKTCDYAPSPLSFEVRDGRRWVRMSIPDQCDWSGASRFSKHLSFDGSSDGIEISFLGTGHFRFPVRIYSGYRVYSGQPLASGVIEVTATSVDYPEVRIYQWVNGQYNDSFYNVCVKQSRDITAADHGNFYCVAKDSMTHFTEKIRVRHS